MTLLRIIVFVSIFISTVRISCIWPPPYEIKLTDGESFVISEWSDSDDLFSDEDEMIPPNSGKPTIDNEKYFRIHQLALRHNQEESRNNNRSSNIMKIPERNFDLEDAIPWEGGFIDKNGDFIHSENGNVYYLNEMAKSLIDSKIQEKREANKETTAKYTIENYDYNNFKSEYNAELEQNKQKNDTFNFTDVKEEESFKDAMGAVVDFGEAKNCSAEESKGIGIKALKCIVTNWKAANSKNSTMKVIEKILKIGLIWFFVYAVIAIPCWCQRGWCCCCCCCKICRPRQNIDETKEYFMNNPAGVVHTEYGKKIEYQPTLYEIETQKKLETALFNL